MMPLLVDTAVWWVHLDKLAVDNLVVEVVDSSIVEEVDNWVVEVVDSSVVETVNNLVVAYLQAS